MTFKGGGVGGFAKEYPVRTVVPKKFLYMTTPEKKLYYMFSEVKKRHAALKKICLCMS